MIEPVLALGYVDSLTSYFCGKYTQLDSGLTILAYTAERDISKSAYHLMVSIEEHRKASIDCALKQLWQRVLNFSRLVQSALSIEINSQNLYRM